MMDNHKLVVFVISLCQLCAQRAMAVWIVPELMQQKEVGQNFSMHCDGTTVGLLNDPDTVVSKLEMFNNRTRLFSCSHGNAPVQEPEISHWNVRCDGLESSSSPVPNGDRFSLAVTIPSLTVADENLYSCQVTHHLRRAPGTDSTNLKIVMKLYVRDSPDKNPCDNNWVLYRQKNSCLFGIFKKEMKKGRDACETQYGGHLLTITTEDFDAYVTGMIRDDTNNAVSFWIGLTDESHEKYFEWMDGTHHNYRNWEAGYPRNNRSSNCVVKGIKPKGKWSDVSCTEEHVIVCEVAIKNDDKKEEYRRAKKGKFGVVIVIFIILTVSVLLAGCLLMVLPQWLLDSMLGGEDAGDDNKRNKKSDDDKNDEHSGDDKKDEEAGDQVNIEHLSDIIDSLSETLDPPKPAHVIDPVTKLPSISKSTPKLPSISKSTPKLPSISTPAEKPPSISLIAFAKKQASLTKASVAQKQASVSTPASVQKQDTINPQLAPSKKQGSGSTQVSSSTADPANKQASISTPATAQKQKQGSSSSKGSNNYNTPAPEKKLVVTGSMFNRRVVRK